MSVIRLHGYFFVFFRMLLIWALMTSTDLPTSISLMTFTTTALGIPLPFQCLRKISSSSRVHLFPSLTKKTKQKFEGKVVDHKNITVTYISSLFYVFFLLLQIAINTIFNIMHSFIMTSNLIWNWGWAYSTNDDHPWEAL